MYLPTLVGHLPDEAVLTMRYFLEFCYLVRRSVITDSTLKKIDTSLTKYMEHREFFADIGVRDSFSVPRLHSVVHYKSLVRDFGAPNGLCSSITESKHIDAVKKPWRRSNRYNALGQMLTTNSRLDKLRASRTLFKTQGMLKNAFAEQDEDDDDDALAPNDSGNQDDEDDGAHDGPAITGFVKLASTPRESFHS